MARANNDWFSRWVDSLAMDEMEVTQIIHDTCRQLDEAEAHAAVVVKPKAKRKKRRVRGVYRKRVRNVFDGDTLTVYQNDGTAFVVRFDADVADALKGHQWRLFGKGQGPYFVTGQGSKTTFLHHVVIGGKPAVGHKAVFLNGDSRDCRRANIRVMSIADAAKACGKRQRLNPEAKGYASWHAKDRRWYCYGMLKGQRIYLGGFPTRDDAMKARKAWMKEHASKQGD